MRHMPTIHPGVDGPEIEIAGRRLRAADIEHVCREDFADRDNAGTLLATVGFGLLAMIVLIGVGEFGWSPRFLVAAAGAAALATMGLSEYWVRAVRYRRYRIALSGGASLDFTTADHVVGDALERLVAQARPH